MTPLFTAIALVCIIIIVLAFYDLELLLASRPEIIGTLIGALLGYELGVALERRTLERTEQRRRELEEEQMINARIFMVKVIVEEMDENLDLLEKLKGRVSETIPERFLRVSSWNVVKDDLYRMEAYDLINEIHNLYFKVELLNKDIDYYRQILFFSVPIVSGVDVNRNFLKIAIRRNSYTIIQLYKELKPRLQKIHTRAVVTARPS